MKHDYAVLITQKMIEDLQNYYNFEDPDIAFMCALEDFLEKKTIEKVNARALIAAAHRSKDTFYKLYGSKKKMVDKLCQKVCDFWGSLWTIENGKIVGRVDAKVVAFLLTWAELFTNFRKMILQHMEGNIEFYQAEKSHLTEGQLDQKQMNRFVFIRYGIKGAIDSWLHSEKRNFGGLDETAEFIAREIKSLEKWVNGEFEKA